MPTIQLQRFRPFQETQSKAVTGPVTGTLYIVDPLGRVSVDTADSPYFIADGYSLAAPIGAATSGIATLDFGPFPGSPSASVTIPAVDAADPNAVLDAWIVQVATVDHSADEHAVDPPMVSAVADGNGNIIITGGPSGRDLFVPPGTPYGAASSQQPIGQIQLMPVGKWSVGWAFSP